MSNEIRRDSANPSGSRTIGLQLMLAALPALGILPMVAFALMLLQLVWNSGQAESRRELQQSVGTLAVAVDREVAGSVRELRRLAEFPTLAPGSLEVFRDYARALVRRNEGWLDLTVTDGDGKTLVDITGTPQGGIDPGHVRAVLASGEPLVSDLEVGGLHASVAVSVPVRREGRVAWVLTAQLDPAVLSRLVGEQLVRSASIAAVLDRNHRITARSRDAERFLGELATADLRQALAVSPERGSARLVTLDGSAVLAAWERMPSGWTVTLGVPTTVYTPPLQRSVTTLVVFGLAVLAGGVLLSLLLGRRIGAAIESVAADARALAAGSSIAPRHSYITQVAAMFASLHEASRVQHDNAVARDVALEALRTSEQRLQLAIDATEAGTFDQDLLTGRGEWSARMHELTGTTPGGPATVDTFLQAVHSEDRAAVRAAIGGVIGGVDDGRLRIECRILPAHGRLRWIDLRAQAHFDHEDARHRRAVRLVGVLVDQTERQRHLEALREADRRKDEFLAMLAHELRNPLAPLRNAVSLLERVLPGSGVERQAVEMSGRQVRHMTRLVNDLLDVSRITQGKIELRREPIRIADAIAQALDTTRPMIEQRAQRLSVHLPMGSPSLVGDGVRLAQVIENLLSNASKYTDHGGSIDVEVDEADDEVVIRVRDTGIGLAQEQLGRVFDLFAQVDATLDRSQGGLGIGLSLVKRLVELHGGRVSAHSDGPGLGASFVVRLPRHEPASLAA